MLLCIKSFHCKTSLQQFLRQFRNYSIQKRKDEVIIPKGKTLTQPWNERKGILKHRVMTQKLFAVKFMTPDFLRFMQTPLDLSPTNVKKWYNRKMEEQAENDQKYLEERYEILGGDLAAAHFVVYRGGAVRFYNEDDWIRQDADGKFNLPDRHIRGLYLDSIDASGINLRNIGLSNLLNLRKLRWLSLSNNPLLDDWSLDTVSGNYYENLSYLDVSNCPRITYRGLSCLYRFVHLDKLRLEGISDSAEFKLACLLLEETKPSLTLEGIDYDVKEEVTAN